MADTATPSDFRLRLAQFTASLAPEQRREFEELLGEKNLRRRPFGISWRPLQLSF